MTVKKAKKVKKVHHISLAVTDAKSVMESWEKTLGIDGWELNADMGGVDAKGRSWSAKEYWTKVGDTVIELIEPVEGRIVQSRFLDERGPGLHHLAFEVDDVEEAIKDLETGGGEVLFHEQGKSWAYVRTGGPDGVIVEISQH